MRKNMKPCACGKPKTGYRYCRDCAKKFSRAKSTDYSRKHEVSDWTEHREEPAKCPRCGKNHTIWVIAPKHLPIEVRRKYCERCNVIVEHQYDNVMSIGLR